MSIGSIPQNIEFIINEEIERINKEQAEKEEKDRAEYQQRLERGRAYIKAYVDREMEFVPVYLREFYHHLNQSNRDVDELAHLYGKENESGDINLDLVFYVPGLAPIVYDVQNESLGCFHAFVNDEESCATWGDWRNSYRRFDRVETVLAIAKEEFDKFQKIDFEFGQEEEKWRERELKKQRRDYERSVMDDAIEEVKEMDDEVLFKAIKDDQVAMCMLKAFLAIQQERRTFEQRIDGAE